MAQQGCCSANPVLWGPSHQFPRRADTKSPIFATTNAILCLLAVVSRRAAGTLPARRKPGNR
ncbi:hypothetical protein MMMB2_2580 [Mycobacterium marinum MB2]|nr:hypothetical protein MMMB2_2580 [Mycobacterium marinum MB2]